MASVRRRRTNKTGGKVTRRTKDKHRRVNIKGNKFLEGNWDDKLTIAQNYKRLGLAVQLGTPAGGVEKDFEKKDEVEELEENVDEEAIPEGEAKIVRDDQGNVVKVIYGTKKQAEDEETVKEKPKTEFVAKLEEYAAQPVESEERYQSVREVDWVEALVLKYGDDYEKMKWDKKLNVNQNSVGVLKKKIRAWKAGKVV